MAKALKIDVDGRVIVTEDPGDGTQSQWCMTPEQAQKHLPTFAAQLTRLAAGDVSAIQDAANDARKQRES